MQIRCITLFPEMFDVIRSGGVVGRAMDRGDVRCECVNPRDYTLDAHRTVDDRPYGGGPGMVMKAEPLLSAIGDAKKGLPERSPVVMLTPQGVRFDQQKASEYATLPGMVLVAGRYEGIDERVVESVVDEELSIGDYVLSGGELAALVVIDSVVRLLPNVLGDERSAQYDSFVDGLLDHPHYTRPDKLAGAAVPDVLVSGDHNKIADWRLKQALGRTWQRRPDLLKKRGLSDHEKALLEDYIEEHQHSK